ncbi:MAG TPA: hypothetical protein PKD93_07545, partial [Ferruginibacter sp.]|nr:hypothetical protein [Ferruginibacter sp.]
FDKKADSLRIIEDQKRQRKIDSIENVQKTLDSIKNKIENDNALNLVPEPVNVMRGAGGSGMVEM